MARNATNKLLHKAKKSKSDEFYTQYIDIQKEIEAYLEYNPYGIVNISSVPKYPKFIQATDLTAVPFPLLTDGGNPSSVTVVTRTVL